MLSGGSFAGLPAAGPCRTTGAGPFAGGMCDMTPLSHFTFDTLNNAAVDGAEAIATAEE